MPPLKSGLGQLDPNASSARANSANLSKQSLEFDRSESFLGGAAIGGGGGASASTSMLLRQPPQPTQLGFPAPSAAAASNISMPTAHVVTERPPPPQVNHRDRFQAYLERYAPDHPETALRRARLITAHTASQHFEEHHAATPPLEQQQHQMQRPEMVSASMMMIAAGRQVHQQRSGLAQQQQQQLHPTMHEGVREHPGNDHNNGAGDDDDDDLAADVLAHSQQALDVRPDRLRFELCAARSEADQLRRRIVTLTRMNEHLQDKLRDSLLSEREQAVRANSIESQDRSLQERLGDAEAEVRELKRRLAESQSSLSRSETQLAQCRGRLAAFDHIAEAAGSGGAGGVARSRGNGVGGASGAAGVSDSVTELVQTLSTSQYLLSVLSVLRFIFSSDNNGNNNNRSPRISVHLGGGLPPAQIGSTAQALDALQELLCGNRETQSEMRTRVVGWTPDDMLREIRSVVMTAETMVVRLLTDGSVGAMIRTGRRPPQAAAVAQEPPPLQRQQQLQLPAPFQHMQPQQAAQPQNLMSYLAPPQKQAVVVTPQFQAQVQQQQQQQQHVAAAPYDPMLFEQEQTPFHQDQPAPMQQRVQTEQHHDENGADGEDDLWLLPNLQQRHFDAAPAAAPQPEQQQPRRVVLHPVRQQQQQQQQQPVSRAHGDTISHHIHKVPLPTTSRSPVAAAAQQHQQQARSTTRNLAATYEAEPAVVVAAGGAQDESIASTAVMEERLRSSFGPAAFSAANGAAPHREDDDPCKVQ